MAYLTNERFSGVCPDNFELTNRAIGIIKHMIRSGREFTITKVLEQLRKNPHMLHEMHDDSAQ
ncbi:MAG: hypothetical protein KBC64_06835 [Simkaniaceae bacterium]|nr:hypothetical protein [Simkaniaceae bacterium]